MKECITFLLAVVLCCVSLWKRKRRWLPKEDTTRNQWFSFIYNTVPEEVLRVERALYIYSPRLQFLPARDSNSQPFDYEPNSLTIKPQLPRCVVEVCVLRVCAAYFKRSTIPSFSIKCGNSNFARTVWCIWLTENISTFSYLKNLSLTIQTWVVIIYIYTHTHTQRYISKTYLWKNIVKKINIFGHSFQKVKLMLYRFITHWVKCFKPLFFLNLDDYGLQIMKPTNSVSQKIWIIT